MKWKTPAHISAVANRGVSQWIYIATSARQPHRTTLGGISSVKTVNKCHEYRATGDWRHLFWFVLTTSSVTFGLGLLFRLCTKLHCCHTIILIVFNLRFFYVLADGKLLPPPINIRSGWHDILIRHFIKCLICLRIIAKNWYTRNKEVPVLLSYLIFKNTYFWKM